MKVNKSIGMKERKRYTLDRLGGVDFSSSPLLCAPTRSPDAVNWIGDHGINRKRHGWEQVFDTFPVAVNGIFPLSDTRFLAHVGSKIYLCNISNGVWSSSEIYSEAESKKSQLFASNGIYYFVFGYVSDGGLKCYNPKNENEKVTISEPYIPTTTININCTDEATDEKKQVKDYVNLLTPKRKNTLVGAPQNSVWKLDGELSSSFQTVVYYKGNTYMTVKRGDNDYAEGLFLNGDLANADNIFGKVDYENNTIISSDKIDTTSSVKDASNIVVEFTDLNVHNTLSGNKITYCTFGTLFGVGGANDRLFLSGNSEYPNVIFFSEVDDFTYFPDIYTIAVGTSNSPITGFLRLSDNTLAVFKEPREGESSVYYIRGEYRTQYDKDDNLVKATPVFSITAGSTTESAVNPFSTANFQGDNVLVSKHGVFGIEPTSNVLTDTRTARERSYAISKMMTESDLSNAAVIVHNGRLYVSVGDKEGHCFVADAAYKYVPEGAENYNYEWWYWDHVPARVWAEIGGELWFGTSDGRICRFTDGYTDVSYDFTREGEIGYNDDTSVVYNEQDEVGEILDGHRVKFVDGDWSDAIGDLKGVDLYAHLIVETDKEGKVTKSLRFARYPDANEYITFESNGTNPILRVFDDRPVVAEWNSPPLDLGNDAIAKTLYSLTVTAEARSGKKLIFGYDTRTKTEENLAEGFGAFSFEDFSFENFTFDGGFQNSFTIRSRARNFNFIRFFIKSDEGACAVHRISAIYKYNKYSKGVM